MSSRVCYMLATYEMTGSPSYMYSLATYEMSSRSSNMLANYKMFDVTGYMPTT